MCLRPFAAGLVLVSLVFIGGCHSTSAYRASCCTAPVVAATPVAPCNNCPPTAGVVPVPAPPPGFGH